MKKVLFIDRDGTLISEPGDFQVDSFEKLAFVPGVFSWLGRIVEELDYVLVMVTNQDGLGTDKFPMENFAPIQEFVVKTLASQGISFSDIYVDRSFEHENLPTRKPNTAMLTKYLDGDYDLENSFVIGDRSTDVALAKNLGCKAIFLGNHLFEDQDDDAQAVIARSWEDVYTRLKLGHRRVRHRRQTSETDISVELGLDGRGRSEIATGISFLDHMLEQLARHGSMDLKIDAKGDLHIDEHHTIEDVAITLGEAFSLAVHDKNGMERYGFTLPMDDCLAQVVVDFGGRSWIVWDAEFKREKIGDMPTEMIFHFFKSFSDKAQCNLNVKAEGTNEHHKVESIFKAFAKAVKMAVRKDLRNSELPSTKGIL